MSERCAKEVWDRDGWGEHRCRRKGTVQEGEKWFCTQHSTAGKKAREAKAEEKRRKQEIARKRMEAGWVEMDLKARGRADLAEAIRAEYAKDVSP